MSISSEVLKPAAGSSHPIEFDGVVKKFGQRTVLNDLSFSVPEGKIVGLLGPNGAGKSTAMRVLLGLHQATEGEARIMGYTKRDKQFRTAVRRVGAIIEAPPLYKNVSPLANLAIRVAATGLKVSDSEVRSIINRVGLADRADDKVGDFSLGMRQRMGIALALVGDPRIVVMDEPTNGLDPEGSVEIRNLITSLPEQGATALVCTHRLAEIEKTCDYVVVLRQGTLVTQGSLDEILAQSTISGHRITVAQDEIAKTVEIVTSLGLGEVSVDDGAVTTTRSAEDSGRITYALSQAGIYLKGLETNRATLEEAFLEITHEGTGARS